MDRIGKVDGRRARRQVLHVPLGGEAEYSIRKEVEIGLEEVHELPVVAHVLLPLEDLAEPGEFLLLAGHRDAGAGFLVFPVGRNTVFSGPVHFPGPDLNLERRSVRSDQGRVEGLVHIGFGHGDIVLETARNGGIHFMDDAQRRVAVLYVFDDYSYFHTAIDILNNKKNNLKFYIFSDDIEGCKNEFRDIDCIFVDCNYGKNSYLDMYLMSLCRNVIISNSTFSWWAAYLNKHLDKIVIAPMQWTKNTKIMTNSFSPDNWIYIN